MAIVHPISLGVEWDVVKSSHFIQHQRKVNTELSVEGVDFYIFLNYFEECHITAQSRDKKRIYDDSFNICIYLLLTFSQ